VTINVKDLAAGGTITVETEHGTRITGKLVSFGGGFYLRIEDSFAVRDGKGSPLNDLTIISYDPPLPEWAADDVAMIDTDDVLYWRDPWHLDEWWSGPNRHTTSELIANLVFQDPTPIAWFRKAAE